MPKETELFLGGYQYTRFTSTHSPTPNTHGWDGSFTSHFSRLVPGPT
jgi:hypothetical protein